jgi:hypothetical protein
MSLEAMPKLVEGAWLHLALNVCSQDEGLLQMDYSW